MGAGMARIVRKETRKRGFFGWVFLLLFLGFNALMAVWVISYWVQLSDLKTLSEAERTGRAIGGTIGTSVLLGIWVAGDIITGLLALLTRGSKVIVEEVVQ